MMRDGALDRRAILKAFGGLAVLGAAGPALGQAAFADDPFSLGVASGEPTADGFVIWTRLAPRPLEIGGGMPMQALSVSWEVATDNRFRTIVARGEEVARPELGHSVHAEVSGLQPARPHWYRFRVGGERSRAGRALTTVRPDAPLARVRMVAGGCQDWQSGYYTAWRRVAEETDLDFIFHYGDYFYESRGADVRTNRDGVTLPTVRRYEGQEAISLDDYRRRYAQTKTDLDLQAAHAAAPWFQTFDDHEVVNNWTSENDGDVPHEVFALRRAGAFQAWWENAPVRRSSLPRNGAIAMYRRARFGDLVDAHFLDTRQFRSVQPCGEEAFQPACPAVRAADASVEGPEQERWLFDGLRAPGKRWNLIAQQVMVTPLDRRREDPVENPEPVLNLDSWAAYDAPRTRLLQACAQAGNAVILTGDEHQNFANEPRVGDRIAATEFVATSITSGGDGSDQRRGTSQILARNPQCRFMNDQRGYLLCEITPEHVRADFRVLERVSVAGSPATTRASFTVQPGRPGLQAA